MMEHVQIWLDRWFPWVFAGLGLLCVILAITNVSIVLQNNDLRKQVVAARIDLAADHARNLAENRAARIAKVVQCRNSIPALERANTVIRSLRSLLRDTATTARSRARLETSAAARELDLQTARDRDAQADRLSAFPTFTEKQCDALGRRLLGPRWKKILEAGS